METLTTRQRTYNSIAEKEKRIEELRAIVAKAEDEIYDLKVEIGEAEGYLRELDYMDGVDPEDFCY